MREGAPGDIYQSARLARAYAFARPAVHPHVVSLIARRLGMAAGDRCRRALDVGCGAGLSTAALQPISEKVVGVEPAEAMLAHRRTVAPGAYFAVGRAEALPFTHGAFDLVTAAGALNYADCTLALDEIARVLAPSGTLVIYDFSGGRRLRESAALDAWFTAFERRYPFLPGYAIDVAALDYGRCALRLVAHDPFEIVLRMDFDAYLRYVLGETNVERAVSGGVPRADVETWCQVTLRPLFARGPLDVLFDGYAAYVTPDPRKERP